MTKYEFLAYVLVTCVNTGVLVWVAWITRAYARTTENILKTTRMASYGSVFIWASERLSDKARVEKRQLVTEELPKYRGTLEDMAHDLRAAFEETCRSYDLVGIACQSGMLPNELITKEWGNSIIVCYEAGERFVNELRQQRGKRYFDNYTQLYNDAKKVWR